MAAEYEFGSEEFHKAMWEAGHAAFERTLAAGLPVFYLDSDGRDLMLQPDGRKFEVRWIPGAPSGHNWEIVRELKEHAA